MGDKTGISWTDATWNCAKGCSRVSAGCENCYAEVQAARIVRMGKGKPTPYDGLVRVTKGGDARWTGAVRLDAKALALPLRWQKPRRIFVNSMSDLFHEKLTNEQIAAVFGVMAASPRHTFQVLTKRAKRMREWYEWIDVQAQKRNQRLLASEIEPIWDQRAAICWDYAKDIIRGTGAAIDSSVWDMEFSKIAHEVRWPLPNVWLGVSVENQAAADERIPELLRTPAAIRFLSCEPLLGEVDLAKASPNARSLAEDLDWIIAGCESGSGARPCSVEWLRSLRDQCASAGRTFFLKQAWADPALDRHDIGPVNFGPGSYRKAGGVIELPYLDGVQHTAFPAPIGVPARLV